MHFPLLLVRTPVFSYAYLISVHSSHFRFRKRLIHDDDLLVQAAVVATIAAAGLHVVLNKRSAWWRGLRGSPKYFILSSIGTSPWRPGWWATVGCEHVLFLSLRAPGCATWTLRARILPDHIDWLLRPLRGFLVAVVMCSGGRVLGAGRKLAFGAHGQVEGDGRAPY